MWVCGPADARACTLPNLAQRPRQGSCARPLKAVDQTRNTSQEEEPCGGYATQHATQPDMLRNPECCAHVRPHAARLGLRGNHKVRP